MTQKRGPKKPKIVWVGRTPITPITAKESRKIDKRIRIRKHREKRRQRYPEVHGKVVDYINHYWATSPETWATWSGVSRWVAVMQSPILTDSVGRTECRRSRCVRQNAHWHNTGLTHRLSSRVENR
jgi:hypothetical protein